MSRRVEIHRRDGDLRPGPRRGPPLLSRRGAMKEFLVFLFCALALLGLLFFAGPRILISHSGGSHERNASASLKTLATAEADFRANDRDGNGRNDYWRSDVAGLFTLIPKGGTDRDAIRLIEVSITAADDRPSAMSRSTSAEAPRPDTDTGRSGMPTKRFWTPVALLSAPSPLFTIRRKGAAGPSSSTRATRSSRPTSTMAGASKPFRTMKNCAYTGAGLIEGP